MSDLYFSFDPCIHKYHTLTSLSSNTFSLCSLRPSFLFGHPLRNVSTSTAKNHFLDSIYTCVCSYNNEKGLSTRICSFPFLISSFCGSDMTGKLSLLIISLSLRFKLSQCKGMYLALS